MTEQIIPPVKRCTKCGNEYPATTEYFGEYGPKGKTRLRNPCRKCKAAYQAMLRETPGRQQYMEEYHQSAKYRAYLESRSRSPRYKTYQKKYYDTKWGHSDARKAYRDQYRKTSSVNKVINQRRRAKRVNLPDCFTTADWRYALNYWDHRCAACGRVAGLWHVLAMDHWIPLASPDCPGPVPENIIPLCHGIGGCNNSKHDRNPEEWLNERLGPKKAKAKLRQIEEYFNSVKR